MKKLTNPTNYFFQQAEQENTQPNPQYAHKIQKLVNQLINIKKCPLCKKQYSTDFQSQNVPRILIHCGHTFCHSCLVQFYTKRRVRCPMCLKLVKHLDSLDQLPVNHTIISKLLEQKQNVSKQASKSIIFAEFQRAQKAALRSKEPPKFDYSSGLPFCPFHQDRVQHFYCATHKASGCRICAEVGHSNPECQVKDLYVIQDPQILKEIFSHFEQPQQIQAIESNYKNIPQIPKKKVIGEQALWIQNNLAKLDDLDDDDDQHYSV